MQNLGSSSSCTTSWLHSMTQQVVPPDDTALQNSDSTDLQWGLGRAQLTAYLCPPGKGRLQSKNQKRSQVTWYQGMRWHQRHYRSVSVCPWKADSCEALLCSWPTKKQTGCSGILVSSKLLTAVGKTYLHTIPEQHKNRTSYCHSNIIRCRFTGLYIALKALAKYYWQPDLAHRAPVADAYL